MAKFTFDEAFERINEERMIDRNDVLASALNHVVWVAEWHIPGCLSESQSYCTSKKDAISSALMYAEGEKGYPHGMKTALQKYGRFDHHTDVFGNVITEVYKLRLSDLF